MATPVLFIMSHADKIPSVQAYAYAPTTGAGESPNPA
jgi:hypothetical protein